MNASLVEEATAAATSMASPATGLAHAVAQFRIEDGRVAPPAAIGAAHSAPALERPADDRRAAVTGRREPLLTTGAAATEDEDWKEF
jgi:hypothetical protein